MANISQPSSLGRTIQRRPALREDVYNVIFEKIMLLEIAPGARMTVDGLARELGVSQTPIREALARLESEGLVNKTHLIGYSAAPQLSRKQFDDLYEIRQLLEPATAARCALHASDEALAEIGSLCREMEQLGQRADTESYAAFARLDTAFHQKIALGAGNDMVVDALGRLYTHVHLFRLLYHAHVTTSAIDEHACILDALMRRDESAAAAAMHEHIEQSRSRFRSKYPA
jgi:DNA-binding GntR family transcriptional regulator